MKIVNYDLHSFVRAIILSRYVNTKLIIVCQLTLQVLPNVLLSNVIRQSASQMRAGEKNACPGSCTAGLGERQYKAPTTLPPPACYYSIVFGFYDVFGRLLHGAVFSA